MKILRFAALALFAATLAAQAPARDAPIIQIVADYNAARDSQDPKAIEKLFTDDADQLVSSGVWRRGKPTLVEGMLASSAGNPGDRTLTVEKVGFERMLYVFAHRRPWSYGLLSAAMALAAGWVASRAFRRS